MLPPTVPTDLTFPVRRLDQTLEAWQKSQVSSGTGEFDLRIYVLNFALHSTTHVLLRSPWETQVLGGGGVLYVKAAPPLPPHIEPLSPSEKCSEKR